MSKKNQKPEQFIQEYLYIEEYDLEPEVKKKKEPEKSERGVIIIDYFENEDK